MKPTITDIIEDVRRAHTEPRIIRITEEPVDYTDIIRYTVYLDDGRHASTIKREIVREAYRLRDLHLPVNMDRTRRHVGRYVLNAIGPMVQK